MASSRKEVKTLPFQGRKKKTNTLIQQHEGEAGGENFSFDTFLCF
jgi:hypothetical protein